MHIIIKSCQSGYQRRQKLSLTWFDKRPACWPYVWYIVLPSWSWFFTFCQSFRPSVWRRSAAATESVARDSAVAECVWHAVGLWHLSFCVTLWFLVLVYSLTRVDVIDTQNSSVTAGMSDRVVARTVHFLNLTPHPCEVSLYMSGSEPHLKSSKSKSGKVRAG